MRYAGRVPSTNVFGGLLLEALETPLPNCGAEVQRGEQTPINFLPDVHLLKLDREEVGDRPIPGGL